MPTTGSTSFDIFIIGGGINGAAIACDAAGRGLAVGLAEMQDFAEGTSSRSSKLIHGGLRYLETYDFRLVRHALAEREILMAKAPHLVSPLRLVLPHVQGQRPIWMIRLGLFLYDHLYRRKTLPGSRTINLHKHAAGRALKPEFRDAFIYSDCRGDDARLVVANLLGAQRHGARMFPRHRFLDAKRSSGGWSITLEDHTGKPCTVRSKSLVNAGGPWVIDVGSKVAARETTRQLRMVRGSHLVVPRLWPEEHAYFMQTSDGRLMECFPYEDDFTVIGTTDEPWTDRPEDVVISDAEIDYMLGEVNRFFRTPVRRADIVWSFSGVRPLFEVGAGRDGGLSTLTRDYSFEIDGDRELAPVLTVFGGKLTTHRRLAEHAMRELCKIMPWPRNGHTRSEILPGGDVGPGGLEAYTARLRERFGWLPLPQLRRYVRLYGTRTEHLLAEANSVTALGRWFGADLYQAEVDFLVREEWARTADDVLWRRTKIGLRLSAHESDELDQYLRDRQDHANVAQVAPSDGGIAGLAGVGSC